MQILFVHPNFPAQFGPILSRLGKRPDLQCVFVSRTGTGRIDGVRHLRAEPRGGATRRTHYCARTFENAVWQAHAVYEACKAATDLRPDLIVGHSGFGTTLFLRELYACPVVSYFEYYYHPHGSDMDFRPDFPPSELDFLRARARNAMILLDLDACAAGYTPSVWQHRLLPSAWQSKVEVVPDGIDLTAWSRRSVPRRLGNEALDEDMRVVTYVARGLEAMRGFDIFVRVANRIATEMPNVLFVVVGSDRICYGNDLDHIKAKTFREHVLQAERPDLSRFRFLGTVPAPQLAEILSLSDLHIYLTVPFVLSWSLLNALSCECTVIASDTAPVREVVCYSWITGIANVSMIVFVRKSAPEIQFLSTEITERQREDFGVLVDDAVGRIETGRFLPHSGIRFPQNPCVSCPYLGLCLGNEDLIDVNLIRRPGASDLDWIDALDY